MNKDDDEDDLDEDMLDDDLMDDDLDAGDDSSPAGNDKGDE